MSPQPSCSFSSTSTPNKPRVDVVENVTPLDVSASSSFEHILLNKINKTPAVQIKRKRIDCSAKVITTEEFVHFMKESNVDQRKTKNNK